MKRDKQYIETYKKITSRVDQDLTQQTFLMKIIEEVFNDLDLIVWKTDNNGKIVRDSEGNPKVDWIKVIFSLGKILGSILAIRSAWEKDQN